MPLYAWTSVRLGEHSCRVAGLLAGLFKDELLVLSRRIGAPEDNVFIAATVSALLHDAGKAATVFQQRVASRPSFYCHELVSGYLALKTAEEVLAERGCKHRGLLAFLSGVAALRHHHGMRSLSECAQNIGRVPGLSRDEIRLLALELGESCPAAGTVAEALKDVSSRVSRVEPLYSLSYVGRYHENLVKPPGYREEMVSFYSSMLTGFLSLSDYIVASLLDGRSSSAHLKGYARRALQELSWMHGLHLIKEERGNTVGALEAKVREGLDTIRKAFLSPQ